MAKKSATKPSGLAVLAEPNVQRVGSCSKAKMAIVGMHLMTKTGVLLVVLAFLCRGYGADGAAVFDVTTFGCKPDGKTDCKMPFIQAWNQACNSTEPATVVIPPGTILAGEVYFSGPCACPGPLTVDVRGAVLAQTDLSEFTGPQWILFDHVDGVVLTGGGSFNGQGETAWNHDACRGQASCSSRLPVSITFQKVNHSVVQGISMINGKGFHMKISDSSNFTVTNITITAPGDSPNTDGIHISGSDLVTVSKSVIETGDDCISIGDGTTNLSVSQITCGPGHGISIGSLGQREKEDSVRGVTVTNCTLSNTTNGARIKTWHDSPKIEASGIVFEDIVMNGVKNPIIIDQHYGAKNKPGASNVKVSDVHYKNIRGTTITNTVVALNCSDAVPCEGIEVMDVDFTLDASVAATAKDPTLSNACTNAKAVFTGKQNPPPCP